MDEAHGQPGTLSPNANVFENGATLGFDPGWGSNTFSYPLGGGAGQIQLQNQSGFGTTIAGGLSVTLTGAGTSPLVWGSTFFNPSPMYLGDAYDTTGATLTNDINLGSSAPRSTASRPCPASSPA